VEPPDPIDASTPAETTPAPDERCGDGVKSTAEQCDDGNDDPSDGCDKCHFKPVCGNKEREAQEECDDGNDNPLDGCDKCYFAKVPGCGDGVKSTAEQCDDGNDDPSDGCDKCHFKPVCGNKEREAEEECDDGNHNPFDGCAECRFALYCGNGNVEAYEECDDKSAECQDCHLVPVCGNNQLEDGEDCDDGNKEPDDGCNAACEVQVCGNGLVEGTEECDPPGLFCSDLCKVIPDHCGDGTLQADQGEECDDGNALTGDGCRACKIECGDGYRDRNIGEECEPGLATQRCRTDHAGVCIPCLQLEPGTCTERDLCDPATCRRAAACGDGSVDASASEQCDPPDGKSCDATCRTIVPVCGNGAIEVGETCDEEGPHCVQCRHVDCGNGIVDDGEACDPPDGKSCSEACQVLECQPARALNLVPDGGDFGNELAITDGTWKWYDPRISVEFVADDGATAPGALEVTVDNGTPAEPTEKRGAILCLPAQRNTQYQVSGRYKFPEGSPTDSGASITVFAHADTTCSGAIGLPVIIPAFAPVQNDWTRYIGFIDTSVLGSGNVASGETAPPVSISVRLDVIRPADVAKVSVLWDDVAVQVWSDDDVTEICGDCHVDPGEECDDGGVTPGDGCSAGCQREICGNTVLDSGEQCDDGNRTFGDGCSGFCRAEALGEPNSCETCRAAQCADTFAACFNDAELALDGEEAGTERGVLCASLVQCVEATGCAAESASSLHGNILGQDDQRHGYPGLENCYCGSSRDCLTRGSANGSCRAEVEAALESDDPNEIFQRLSGASAQYPVGAKALALLECSATCTCSAPSSCGDHLVQDRSIEFFNSYHPASAERGKTCLTVATSDCAQSGTCGCFFEECDDGNNTDGDGCDAQCFAERCGNGVLQAGEQCDDGNNTDGDGCESDCKFFGECGNGVVEAPRETCDRENSEGISCSVAQAAANPDQCACDSTCRLTVCGDGELQEGEECDDGTNDGVTCKPDCTSPPRDACTDCVLAIDQRASSFRTDVSTIIDCVGPETLTEPPPDCPDCDACLQDATCKALWECQVQADCNVYQGSCYCGPNASIADCIQSSFVPQGACAAETKAAYAAQFGETGTNSAIVQQYLNIGDKADGAATYSLGLANYSGVSCLGRSVPSGGAATRAVPWGMEIGLCAAGMAPDKRLICSSVCFGANAFTSLTQLARDDQACSLP
jgi:cysteine-rich repeat protein